MVSSIISDSCNNGLKRALFSIVKAVFPTKCLSCGKFFHDQLKRSKEIPEETPGLEETAPIGFERETAAYLCNACLKEIVPIRSPICCQCGRMFESRIGDDHLCRGCIEKRRIFGKARSAGVYDKSLMSLIHAFKYGKKIQLADPLGRMLCNTFLRHWRKNEVDLAMPVPLHRERLRERGFNQALMLVRNWSIWVRNDSRADPFLEINHDTLTRIKRTRPQTGLNRKDRGENIKNAFHVKDAGNIQGRRILLVDDVFTTGATIEECARVLKKEGAEKIDVLTLARA